MNADAPLPEGPKFTKRLVMHLNGGSKFSELQYQVLADGCETEIRHVQRTNGSPKYLITDDVFVCGGETFDNFAARGVGLMAWLRAHAVAAKTEGEGQTEARP